MSTITDNRAERLRQAIRLKKAETRERAPELPPRPADQAAHLGEMQRGLWLSHQMDPDSPAYNLASAQRVQGPLDVAKLQWALGEVVARHRLLRSTFHDGDRVQQRVHPPAPLAIEVLEEQDGAGLTAAIREARKPFDLETGPLIRLQLIEETPGRERFLLLVLHHILVDERSLAFLWRELAEAYDGRSTDRRSTDRRSTDHGARVQYDDYVHWLREQGEHRQDLDFWRGRLDPLPDDLRLPFEKPAGETGTAPGRLLTRPANPTVQQAIRRLAADTGVTPFMVYAFAFRLLLHRYTDGQRIAFATPVSTRSHPATARMIGYFTNPVVVSTAVDEARPVAAALGDFSQELREILAHASLSFQALTEELSPPRQPNRHPIFQTMFVYQEADPAPRLGEAQLEPVTLDLGASKFDLTLFVTEGQSSIETAVEYRADRFDEVWMQNLLGHYETLLEHLPEDLERATTEVPMLGPRELDQLRADARGAEPETAGMALLPRRILDQAHRLPQSPALTCGGVSLSYSELESSARRIARALAEGGVEPGDRVAVFLDRSNRMIAGIFGSHLAGAAYVPLDPAYPQARNQGVLEDAEVAAVLTTSTLRDQLPAGPWSVIDVDAIAPLDSPEENGPTTALADLSPESPAYILYTSGSTGQPKGVVITHDNLRASNGVRPQAYGISPKRFLLLPSIAFDSSVVGIFWTLAAGGTLVIPTDDEARDPGRLVRLVAEQRVTGLLCVPSLHAQMLTISGDLLRGLELAIVAGESCSSRLVEEHFRALPHVRLFNEYGPTEATVWATFHEFSRDEIMDRDAASPVAIGRPIPGVRVDVVDGLGRPVPAGIPGHAWIAGPTVARGYWRRRDLTDERFVPQADGADPGISERRYRTGDRMSWTPDGRLLFLGREDEQIKLRGFRIEPGEIEAALLESPEIEQAAVVARPLGSTSETVQLVAFIQATHTDASSNQDAWRQDLAKRMPAHMIPSRLVDLPELPRLPNGKTDRQRLRDLQLDAETQAGKAGIGETTRVPSTSEQTLLSLWEGLLGRSGITLSDNFFELGGHSLLVTQMTLAIERDFEVSLSAADVFENPTAAELARRIEQRGGSAAPPYQHLFPLQPTGRGMPFIVAVPHFFSQMFAERFRGERPVYGLRGVSLRAEGNRGRWPTMTDLGEDLVDEIQRRFPGQTCIMVGYSFGASMAIEAVRVMEERGIPVHQLYLIAPMPLDSYRFGPFRMQIDNLRQPVDELSASEALRRYARANNPLTRQPYERAWRWLAVQSWRRLLCFVGRLRGLAGLPLTPRILHADVRVERFRLHAQYRPGVVHTPTVVFNAKEPATDAAATWRPYFQGPFTVHPTPDPHLDEASVRAARELILHHLQDLGDS